MSHRLGLGLALFCSVIAAAVFIFLDRTPAPDDVGSRQLQTSPAPETASIANDPGITASAAKVGRSEMKRGDAAVAEPDIDQSIDAAADDLDQNESSPAGEAGEKAENLIEQQAFWLNRVTYPTGRFDPAWIRNAAAQDEQVERALPFGIQASRGVGAPDSLNATAFTALGPNPENMTGCTGCYDYGKTAGRVNAITIDPTTTTPGSIVAYLATVGGGVAKTTNCCTASTTWSLVTDDPLISTTSIDTITLDPNHHRTVYAGTGDLNFGSFSMGSQGVLKSTDAGATWSVLGASVFGAAYTEPANQFPQYDAVGKVRVDPNNSNRVVAGTKKGIYISYDSGNNWTGPCTTNSFTTQRQDTTALELTNMGGGVTRILVGIGTRGFATPVQYDLGAQGANGLYKGTMPASGCPGDFSLITRNDNGFVFGTAVSGSPYATGAAMNAGSGDPYVSTTSGNQLSRMDIAVAPSNPNYIYVQGGSIAANNNSGCGNAAGCQLGVWSSIDGGVSWSYMTGSAGGSLRACGGTGTQGVTSGSAGGGDYAQNWYDQGIAVDPNNPDRVFVDTFDTWLATRTGSTFYNVTCGYAGNPVANHAVHVDHHALAFIPGSSSQLLEGSDGGIFYTGNAHTAAENTARPTWVNMDNGLNTIEFYAGDISGNFANDPTPHAVAGAQDNGPSSVKFAGSPTGPSAWQMGLGGDGFSGQIDPIGTGPTQAVGTITVSALGVAGQTFTIGGQTFTWAATRTVAGTVAVGTSANSAATNIRTAVNADLTGVATAGGSGGSVTVTAVTPGAGGNSIVFTNVSSTNLTFNGTGTLGGTIQGGLPGSLRIWQGNNSGGLSRCILNCTNPGASWANSRGSWSGDQQSFVLPINMFHGGIAGGDDCGPAGPTSGCSHLIAGTTRVWETISGANATVPASAWYSTNSGATCTGGTTPCLTKGTLGNRSYINQVKYSPKFQSVAIVGTNDGNVQIGFNMGTGTAGQANWVDVTGGNSTLPNRPVLGIALDPSVATADVPVGYAAVGGFNANSPTTPGHVFRVDCGSNCASFTWADKSGNLPDIPVDSIAVNPNFPQQVFAGTDFGLYFTNDINAASPQWYRFTNGLPAVMIWDMQVDRGSTTLALFTRGRGVFVWPLPFSAAPTPTPSATATPIPACPIVTTPVLTSQTAAGGVPITIPINTTDTTGKNIISADITFNYSTTVLSGAPADISITAGSVTPGAQINYNASSPGTLVISVFNTAMFSGEGPIVDLHMKIIGPIGSSTPLTIGAFKYNGGLVCSSFSSGSLTIIGGTITGRATFENEPYPISTVSPTPTPKRLPDASIVATGGTPTVSTLTDADGFYSLTGFGPGSYTVTASKPDENYMTPNGIFSSDPTLVARHVVGLESLNAVQQRAADVSGLHSLSSFDAALIAQWIVGIPNVINQTGKWVFTPTTTTPNTFVDSVQNYKGLLMGDVNADWLPPSSARPDSILPDSNSIGISVPNTKAARGTQVMIPVSVANLKGREISSYQFDVHYDPAVMTPAQTAASLTGTICDGMGLAANSPEPGLLKVVVYGIAPVSVDGVYVNLRFTAIGSVGAKSPVTIEAIRMNGVSDPVRATNGVVEITRTVANTDPSDTVASASYEIGTSAMPTAASVDVWQIAVPRSYALSSMP